MTTKSESVYPAVHANASLVGNIFVNKYYNVLHQSPDVVNRFYTDRSILSRAETGPDGKIDVVVSQNGIHRKIMSVDYTDFRAEIKTVDSLESLNGSVLVMVTGALSTQGHMKRNFVQTFFLAPQEVGYFVLNDMFRYLDGEPEPVQPTTVSVENGEIEQHIPVSKEQEPVPPEETRAYSDSLSKNVLPAEVPETAGKKSVEEEKSVEYRDVEDCTENKDDVCETVLQEELDVYEADEEQNHEEAPKKSYASILCIHGGMSAVTTTGVKHLLTNVEHQKLAASVQPPMATVSSNGGGQDVSVVEGDGRSIYIKNLSLNITVSELEVEFKKFGAIESGGINLRNQRFGVCFAFIEYEEPSSAQSAIEASPIRINGRYAYIEEKKPVSMSQRAGRGRNIQGRVYQNEGSQGRYFLGGRGFPRAAGQAYRV